ncbi:uncharacterized protein LOC113555733 [Rhopalosiphum maidis]|uniref:uncharacterized protein LOC113555733 n=1 Tax=Rhopalosiphum maidis TaxID=43146 RepID=UPI000EFFB3E7|nr:uncharacterized protein LOC113555733 [Rhopalosiphum maidis]
MVQRYVYESFKAETNVKISGLMTQKTSKKKTTTENAKNSNKKYLATGLAFREIAITFRISKTAVSSIVIEVCKVIWKILKGKHIPSPTVADFENIAQEFYENWNFPNCIGSLDGKHIRIKCPKKSGSMFFNYKQFFSIVLMAVADANYKFIMIDVGAYEKDSDEGVLSNSNILKHLENKTLKLPYPKKLPNSNITGPYNFIADEAFSLRTYLMQLSPRRLLNDENKIYFNYRLSRARMTIECAFGIAAAKFRILQKSIETKVENADHVVKAICTVYTAQCNYRFGKNKSYRKL